MAFAKLAHLVEDSERTRDVIIDESITFNELFLSPSTLVGLEKCGFKRPSPIQLKAIPLGKCGFDLIVEAKSGTGKTIVFGVIALESLVMNLECQCLILAPTREIVAQIGEVITAIGHDYEGLDVEVVMGGTNMAKDIQRLEKGGFQIIVGSPGRMKHLIQKNIISLESVRLLVLDEADKLMEECFQKDINFIFSKLPERKQLIMASATYTKEMKDFLSLYMRSPTHVSPYTSCILLGVKQFVSIVPNHLNTVRQNQINFEELTKILSEVSFSQCLIFCNYQSRTRITCNKLIESGWPAQFLCSSQKQEDRLASLKMLQSFQCRILVATDLAARGIDAANVDLIINLECPYDLSTYLHRIGRSGRYGSKGTAITILPKSEEEKFTCMLHSLGGEYFDIKPFRTLNVNIDSANNTHHTVVDTSDTSQSILPLLVDNKTEEFTSDDFKNLLSSYNDFKKKYILSSENPLDPSETTWLSNEINKNPTYKSQNSDSKDFINLHKVDIQKTKRYIEKYLDSLYYPKKDDSKNTDVNNSDNDKVDKQKTKKKTENHLDSMDNLKKDDSQNTGVNSSEMNEQEKKKKIEKYLDSLYNLKKDDNNKKVVSNNSDNDVTKITDIEKKTILEKDFASEISNKVIDSGANLENDHQSNIIGDLRNKSSSSVVLDYPIKKNKKSKGFKGKKSQGIIFDYEAAHIEDEYLRWRRQLACVTNFIQQSVYLETICHFNNCDLQDM